MSGLLKIGELAKQTGLSVRTLHYYDEIQLLVPSHRSESDHRLYSDRDIIRLQQILSLRQLGFSLSEIRNCLERPGYSLPQVIELHRHRLHEQISLSHTLLNRLNSIVKELETTQSVAVGNLIQTMETITMTTQYFTPEQQKVLDYRLREGEEEWQKILNGIRTEMNRNSALNSPSVRMLARRWLWSMKSFVQGDGEIYESLIKMYQREGNIATDWGMDSAAFDYILRAIFSMALGDVTNAAIPRHKIFTAQTQEVVRLGEIPIREINFDILGTECALLGILAEGKSIAARALTSVGVSYERVHPIVIKWLGTRPAPPEGTFPPTLPFAPRMKRVIELALDEAKQQEKSQIAPEHLLLAILEEYKEAPAPGGVATYILREELNMDLQALEQCLRVEIDSQSH
ncbi:MerR, DNA binding family [Synechococcus sp. PCC 7335]|uniref:MerR family transcriptional regulator n=1 Tax=Synechococcus sp. (strain ATCC 29403 / PCC 7335) TaxID=91464 RepID=UPI00017EC46A|nr:MerR family transcriptional regulator [Synechococcus sp. PCC 7335]EDX83485.1 MerR, DNA binding family [Synechococcus sp. PCC 7335]